MGRLSKEESSWVFYDWGNSAYSVIISTAVFPLFYKSAATNGGISPSDSTAYLGYTICIYAFFLDTTIDFWILAMLVATSQGGIQALSRAYFAKLVPKENANEFFGFYNIFGKFASILGPLLLGATAQFTGSSSSGVFSLIILFLIGIVILTRVPEPKTKKSV